MWIHMTQTYIQKVICTQMLGLTVKYSHISTYIHTSKYKVNWTNNIFTLTTNPIKKDAKKFANIFFCTGQ